MPFSAAYAQHGLVERAQAIRKNPVAAYGAAVGAVALATLMRWLVGSEVIEGIPFITYFPAIVIATLVGGFWPGILATLLSSALAWYIFLPPTHGWGFGEREIVSLLVFVSVAGINVVVVALLNAAVERVMAQQENMRVLIESAPNGIVVVDDRGEIKLVNPSAELLFGYTRSELVGQNVEMLVPQRHVAAHEEARQNYARQPRVRQMGAGRYLSGRRKDGSEFPIAVGLNPVTRNGNRAVLATVVDISERRRAEESQQLVIRELQHRTRNLFAVFEAIANRTVDEGRTAAEIKFVLNGRLRALARAYTLLADASWQGVSLAAILEREFAGFSRRVDIGGCDVVVSPSAAQQFAMIVHELATNALKYGALSAAEGRVAIAGRIEEAEDGEVFSFLWTESGGPPVSAPTRKGFGSVILIDSAQQFGRKIMMNYARNGLTYSLQIGLSAIAAANDGTQRRDGGEIVEQVGAASM